MCQACSAALINPASGLYLADCEGCAARALSRSPDYLDSAQKGSITPNYRLSLMAAFDGEIERGHKLVKSWHAQLEALKA